MTWEWEIYGALQIQRDQVSDRRGMKEVIFSRRGAKLPHPAFAPDLVPFRARPDKNNPCGLGVLARVIFEV